MDENTEELTMAPAVSSKLTQWAKEPAVQSLKGDLELSRPAHDTFVAKVRRWNELSKVTGSAKPKARTGRSSVQPKLIRRQAEWRYSALTEPFNSSDKLFEVKPTTWEDADSARQNELVLNYQFSSKINSTTFIDNYVRAAVDEGSVIVRLGWSRLTKEVQEEVPVWDYVAPDSQEQIQQLEAAIKLKKDNPRAYNEQVDPSFHAAVSFFEETGQPSVAIQNGTTKVKSEKVIDNRPVLNLVDPENFYFDPTCGDDLDKANFVVISFETSKAELMKEPKRYKNLDQVNWGTAEPQTDPYHSQKSTDENFNFRDDLRRRVVAYEYWGLSDINGTGELVPIVATWIGDTIVRMEKNPFPDQRPPFVLANYMPNKRELMGEPDAELLEDNQKILGAVSRGMIDLLGRSANSQQGFAKGMLDVSNRRRYENGHDYEYNPNINPKNGIIEHKYPEIPQSAMLMLNLQNQEAESLTGVKAFSGGLSGEAYGDVAAGIRGVLDASSKREMAILRRLASGILQIGKKIISMNYAFLSEQEVVRITNDEFITVNREELASAAEFDMKVDISTAEIDNNKAQDLAFMLQTIGPNGDFEMTKLILTEIARLKRMPELAHQIKTFEPKPDPVQQKIQELTVKKLELEIAELDSKAKLNLAKAKAEEVDAEKKALDTVEQETGTAHAREMEKQTAQSTGNQDLEVTKSLLKPRKEGESAPEIEAALGYNELSKRSKDQLGDNNPEVINSIMNRNNGPQTDPTLDPALNQGLNL